MQINLVSGQDKSGLNLLDMHKESCASGAICYALHAVEKKLQIVLLVITT